MHQHDPSRAAYNELTAIQLSGHLDVSALEQAIHTIVARHDVLRTRYVIEDGRLRAVLETARPLKLPMVEAQRDVDAQVAAEARRPFDLSAESPFRARLLRLAEREHLLLVTIHHIAFDGWSQELLWRELTTLYEAFRRAEESPLAALPWQYADFVAYQRERLTAEIEAEQLTYWTQRLSGAPAAAVLPCDASRPTELSFRGGRVSRVLPAALTEPLKATGREEGATLYMVLLAAFATLWHRYTQQTDLVIGTPYAERKRRELARLIGFCVNTLPLRLDLSARPTFRELLACVRATALGALDRAEVPFDRVVQALELPRQPAIAPLVQVMFQLRRHPGPVMLPELTFAERRFDLGTAKSELAFELAETSEGLLCEAEFSSDLFERRTVERLLASYQALLESIVADPKQSIARLQLLSDDEWRRMLALGQVSGPGATDGANDVVAMFREQVTRRGDAVAAICEGRSLTYDELDRRSSQLARHLQDRGVAVGDRVVLYDERSVDVVVAVLAIFKAGGVYVPLDSDTPLQRLRTLLDDIGPSAVLTCQRLLTNLVATDHAVCLDLDAKRIAGRDDSPLGLPFDENQLAYILFTSGSSGTPKGVMVSHRSLASHCQRIRHEYELSQRDRVLQYAPLTFDPSLEQTFCSLLSGATLVLRGNEPWDGGRLCREVCASRLTFVNVTPVVLRQWIDALEGTDEHDRFGSLRLVIIGGDVLPPAVCEAWRRVAPRSIRLLNAYGPTEATITSTLFDVAGYDPQRHGPRMPIGRPAGNSCVYILDEHLEPAPRGAPGEVYLGGEAVAAGYWRRDELTAERFVPDPFADNPQARLYKTGDLARWTTDGQVDFLWRSDQQVKIRGCRIEPGEVEAALVQHPSVREAVVVPHVVAGRPQLVAYFVGEAGRSINAPDLRNHLRGLLPAFMIPSAFEQLATLPMTRQGKVDLAALPAPGTDQESRPERTAPRSAAEEQLATVWQRVLETPDFGVTDNFFDAGGDSLSAVALVAEINRTLGVDLPLAMILHSPTIEQQARLVDAPRPQSDGSLVLLQPSGSRPPFFCVHTVGGLALRYRSLALLCGSERPFYAIEAQGVDGRRLPQSTVEAMAARYVEEITVVEPRGPYYLGGYCSGGILAYEMAQQLRAAGRTVEHVVLIDSCHPRLWERVSWSLRAYRELKRWVRVAVHFTYQARGQRTPPRVTERIINEVLRRAFTRYRPRPYPGRLSMIRSQRHPYGEHPLLGWATLVAADTPERFVNCDHEEILSAAHVRETATAVRETLHDSESNPRRRAA